MMRPPTELENATSFCGTPSSRIWNSSILRSGTNLPSLSRTTTLVVMRSVVDRNVGACWFGRGAAVGVVGFCCADTRVVARIVSIAIRLVRVRRATAGMVVLSVHYARRLRGRRVGLHVAPRQGRRGSRHGPVIVAAPPAAP